MTENNDAKYRKVHSATTVLKIYLVAETVHFLFVYRG